MIRINITKEENRYVGFELSGHAQAGEYGQDIVCAAVSSQVILMENSLEQLLQVKTLVEADEEAGGYIKLSVPNGLNVTQQHDVQLLLRHLAYALEALATEYPKYIAIQIKSKS